MKTYLTSLILAFLLARHPITQGKILTNTDSQVYRETTTTYLEDWTPPGRTFKEELVKDTEHLFGIDEALSKMKYDSSILGQHSNHEISIRTSMSRLGIYAVPKFQEGLRQILGQPVEFYGYGKDIYTVGGIKAKPDTYAIFKNKDKIFTHKMYYGAEDVIDDASVVLNSPAFTFLELTGGTDNNPIVTSNIWYNGETINEKYHVDGSSYLFAYKGKIGFVGTKNKKDFFFFNGQKVSPDFDDIRTHSCCMSPAYPMGVDENGILFSIIRIGSRYPLVEINLNKYLK